MGTATIFSFLVTAFTILFLFLQLIDLHLLVTKTSQSGCGDEGEDIVGKSVFLILIETVVTARFAKAAKATINPGDELQELYLTVMEFLNVSGGAAITGEINDELNDPNLVCK